MSVLGDAHGGRDKAEDKQGNDHEAMRHDTTSRMRQGEDVVFRDGPILQGEGTMSSVLRNAP